MGPVLGTDTKFHFAPVHHSPLRSALKSKQFVCMLNFFWTTQKSVLKKWLSLCLCEPMCLCASLRMNSFCTVRSSANRRCGEGQLNTKAVLNKWVLSLCKESLASSFTCWLPTPQSSTLQPWRALTGRSCLRSPIKPRTHTHSCLSGIVCTTPTKTEAIVTTHRWNVKINKCRFLKVLNNNNQLLWNLLLFI